MTDGGETTSSYAYLFGLRLQHALTAARRHLTITQIRMNCRVEDRDRLVGCPSRIPLSNTRSTTTIYYIHIPVPYNLWKLRLGKARYKHRYAIFLPDAVHMYARQVGGGDVSPPRRSVNSNSFPLSFALSFPLSYRIARGWGARNHSLSQRVRLAHMPHYVLQSVLRKCLPEPQFPEIIRYVSYDSTLCRTFPCSQARRASEQIKLSEVSE